ncbi:hypothetical protein EDB92DRAFT_2116491 [Lactarius akahatsu]|uniref:Uncharacterized protein n=1 Tax=Lactarius akahatsu TaxID=416441 RepID=A0AAD4LC95_9AGAM|nr:hypothetical protein EDB92DRAFT_2116491 [Lactarius akahatsu]
MESTNLVSYVTQYHRRGLAAHLRTALAHYVGMFAAALSVVATHAAIVTGFVFFTALSGSGLQRVLTDGRAPRAAMDELLSPSYADAADFEHRVLATALLFASTPAMRATAAALAMANVQAALGISTLLCLVPVPLATTHQAGGVALLSAVLHVLLYCAGQAPLRARGDRRIWRERQQQKPIESTITYWGVTSEYTSVKYTTTD